MFEPETGFMVSGGSDAKIIVWDLGGEFFAFSCPPFRSFYKEGRDADLFAWVIL